MGAILVIVGAVLLAFLFSLLYAILLGFPVMIFWNAVIPDLFNLPAIGFWQAVFLTALCSLLFKSSSSSSSSSKD